MKKIVDPRSRKSGSPPGSLIYVVEKRVEEVSLSQITYSDNYYKEDHFQDPAEIHYQKDSGYKSWINVDGVHQEEIIRAIGEKFGIHLLTLEDIMDSEQQPKADYHEDYVYFVIKMLLYDKEKDDFDLEQVSIVFGEDFLLSFQEKEGDVFEQVRRRIRSSAASRIKKLDMDYLAYSLMDIVIDNYFYALEKIGERIESLEIEMLEDPRSEILNEIHSLKKKLLVLRRSVWPLREAVAGLQRQETKFVREETIVFLRDLYDHVVQIIETIEISRDMLSSLIDLYITNNSNKMNETMKVLTIIATIFIPLTFITGIYGMNFINMPEIQWKFGYPAVMAFMLLVAVLMIVFFRKKKWL